MNEAEIQRQKEIQGSRGTAFYRAAGARIRQRPFSRTFRGGLGDALSAGPGDATSRSRSIARGGAAVFSIQIWIRLRLIAPRIFRARHRWSRPSRSARDDRAEGISAAADFRSRPTARFSRKSARVALRRPFSPMRIIRLEFARCFFSGRVSRSRDGCHRLCPASSLPPSL